ncbi:hypothetical protein WI80_33375 [Burkholderia ubonensis]|uniref:hypothetical protein n=1 Tax=Burkholderia ubonensis TaxID=101571 RepID=UPI0007570C08|nr:hypothetical protein [Burkholderia ubonensis]KVD19188.1 hypothetical protein WI80_33375 [Burkholderia ubonensis]KVU12667.1 hypothetical protein WK63_19405 [Burkholderia ubonensis]
MALFSTQDGSYVSGDAGAIDWATGDATLGSYDGLSGGIGDGYGFATTPSNPPPSSTGQTIGDLQSGSTNFNWNAAFTDTLGALVAVDSINHGLPTQATQGYYKASNGKVYPNGYGPASGLGLPQGGLGSLLVIGLVVFVVLELAKEGK